ncbi:hypothetical protein D6858_12925 [Tsuneonella suprasediminis]|uniref:DUF11 domain-containing protein n=1 Tax=Tsuneonella suprasediminis TaxID=2306996 RepID=A0A419R049_9SPHN|nr:hypothetical protein [Tsuneonella suprasediminis]RJX66407.1 hypothetical protein D6858_12925 [Tsuneonella suprasediminis]
MMVKHLLLALSCAIATLFPLHSAQAAGKVALTGDVKVVRMVGQSGAEKETLSEPTKVVPGDKLVFTTHYSNDTGEEVDDFVITNPIPEQVTLSEEGDFTVSVDGGKNFGQLAALSTKASDGTAGAATLNDVTHIRWALPKLKPGATGSVRFSAVIR